MKALAIYCWSIWSAQGQEVWVHRGERLRDVPREVGISHSDTGSRSELCFTSHLWGQCGEEPTHWSISPEGQSVLAGSRKS